MTLVLPASPTNHGRSMAGQGRAGQGSQNSPSSPPRSGHDSILLADGAQASCAASSVSMRVMISLRPFLPPASGSTRQDKGSAGACCPLATVPGSCCAPFSALTRTRLNRVCSADEAESCLAVGLVGRALNSARQYWVPRQQMAMASRAQTVGWYNFCAEIPNHLFRVPSVDIRDTVQYCTASPTYITILYRTWTHFTHATTRLQSSTHTHRLPVSLQCVGDQVGLFGVRTSFPPQQPE